MNFKRVLQYFLISIIFILPLNVFAINKYLIPGGDNIGIKVSSAGVYVAGFYPVNDKYIAKEAGLKIGDLIISINDEVIDNISDLVNRFDSNEPDISIKIGYLRDNIYHTADLFLTKDKDNIYKTGLYVKDSIVGIGTLTYIDPINKTFGALGHIVGDAYTNNEFVIRTGNIFSSNVVSIVKSSLGKPGEKVADINNHNIYGTIKKNNQYGLFGTIEKEFTKEKKIEVGSLNEVTIGNAEIITVINGNKKEKFDVEILSIDKSNNTKNFLIKITDKALIKKTGGIIKGMSGSPIIQNGKIIGAITHAIVDNPIKGYGIGIENMLKE